MEYAQGMSTSITIDLINKLNHALFEPKKTRNLLKRLSQLNQSREKRVERVEAICIVSSFMSSYLELSTLQIGTHNKEGKFIPLCDYKYIAQKTGLVLLRVKRAMKDMKDAGYLRIKQLNTRLINGSFVGLTSIKTFTEVFFNDLGINSLWLKSKQAWKKKRLLERRPAPIRTTKELKVMQTIKNVLGNLSKAVLVNRTDNDGRQRENNVMLNQAILKQAQEMTKETGRSFKDCYVELTEVAEAYVAQAPRDIPVRMPQSSKTMPSFAQQELERRLQAKETSPATTGLLSRVNVMQAAAAIASREGRDYAEVYEELTSG